MELRLPNNAKYILNKLNECGYEAYIVGGCVRDSIIGLVPHDWDICTSALPEQIITVFDRYKIIPTGLKHGTVTIVIDDEQYEVTTYRIDGEYKDNRHPSDFVFTKSLREDLSRRDFTINAMAYNPNVGLVDYFAGKKDIKKKVIRCVGKPDERFNEDALRILRAIRFSITLGYEIEFNTLRSIFDNKELLKNISAERINAEMTNAMVCGYSIVLGEIIRVVVPELTHSMIQSAMTTIGIFDTTLNVRLALLFNFDEVQQKEILQRLKFDNKTIRNVCDIHKLTYEIRNSDEQFIPEVVAKQILNLNENVADDVVSSLRCTSYIDSSMAFYRFADMLKSCLPVCRTECYKISHLKVNGEDLKALGLCGKEIGRMLQSILSAVIKNELPNKREDLLEFAKTEKIKSEKLLTKDENYDIIQNEIKKGVSDDVL